MSLWQRAYDARALGRDPTLYRWEYTSCSLLLPGEAVLLAYYNNTRLELAPIDELNTWRPVAYVFVRF